MARSAGTKPARIPTSTRETTPRAPVAEIPELHERIAARAYQIFEKRGRTNGRDQEDWFRAEQEVLSDRMDSDLG